MASALEIGPQEAQRRLNAGKAILIDVREPEEFRTARIDGARLIPMQDIPAEFQKLEELAGENELLLFCHHGVRSLQAAQWLREHGLENCFSVTGGIDRWSREIDPSVPRY
ncbi:MAG TPA: rhodanese-like domain-containing protein [Bryobacteraceae bacterium]